MRPRHASLLLALVLPAPAWAETAFNGYVSERLQLTMPSDYALISTQDLAIMQSLSEGNIQVRFRGLDEKLYLYTDASAFASFAGGYADTDLTTGRLKFVKEHDVPNYRPFVVISEAYGTLELFEHLTLTAGKKRVVWGSGQAFNPTDLINPPRDPTDPNFQRAGAWMLKLDLPFERFTVSGLISPKVLYQQNGIPYALFMYPGYPPAEHVRNPTLVADPRDNQPHYAVAARLYALLFDSDINVWMLYTNLYNDALENKPRAAFSFSRYFFTDYEFHVEALLQLGSNRQYVNSACVGSENDLAGCVLSGKELATMREAHSMQFYPRLLFGTRTMFQDESTLSVEYLFQSDGYDRDEFDDFVTLQKRVGTFQRRGLVAGTVGTTGTGSELPLRFSFDPARRHYLIVSYMKPKILDDWTIQGTSITALEDLSSTLTGSVTWNAQEWLNLALYAFIPTPSLGRLSQVHSNDPLGKLEDEMGEDWEGLLPLGADVDGKRYGEYDALPFRGRVVAEMRAYF
ncbi:MAG: hypothetical protein AB2A00_12140 [Myxococcota bacterium]